MKDSVAQNTRAGKTRMEENLHMLQESTYDNTLKKNIDTKKKFLGSAQRALDELLALEKESQIDQEIDADLLEKMKVIALHDTLSRLPFTPSRDDVIGISLATADLNEQKTQTETSIETLKNELTEVERDLSVSAFMADDFEVMTGLLQERIQEISKERDELYNEVESLTTNETIHRIQSQIDQLKERERQIVAFPGQIVSKYLIEKQASIYQPTLTKSELDSRKYKARQLFELLLNNVMNEQSIIDNLALENNNGQDIEINEDDIYITVANKDDPLIRHLLRADIIIEKKNSNKIKLRPYMSVFERVNI